MPTPKNKPTSKKGNAANGANLGFEQTLWLAADKLRGNMDAAEYKHVVLGLIFLKYISDWGGERTRGDARWKYGVPRLGGGLGLPLA